jgi:hypothetical protein
LALVENRRPFRRFSKLGGKAVDGFVLLFFEAVHGFSTERQRQ